MQKAINILKNQSLTLTINGSPITLLTDSVEDIKLGSAVSSQIAKPLDGLHLSRSNSIEENGIEFVDTKVVADYYGVTTETVRNWIKDGKLSGKQLSGHRGKWFIPAEEFEYLKKQEENDDTEKGVKELLGEDYSEDWDGELEEE